jgi:hypothetical protein
MGEETCSLLPLEESGSFSSGTKKGRPKFKVVDEGEEGIITVNTRNVVVQEAELVNKQVKRIKNLVWDIGSPKKDESDRWKLTGHPWIGKFFNLK